MGWSGSNTATTKSERINELVESYNWDYDTSCSTVISKASVSHGAWMLIKQINKNTNKVVYALMFHMIRIYDGDYTVKSIDASCGPLYYNCSARMVNKWIKLNKEANNELCEGEKDWYSEWLKVQSVFDLKLNDIVTIGSSKEVIFKYWHNKSKTQFVGVNKEKGKLFRYKTEYITVK